MTNFLEMNDDCIDYVLNYFKENDSTSIETMVAISQTCTRLQSLASRFMKYDSYSCIISSDEDFRRAKRTIAKIGNNLVELNVNVDPTYTTVKPTFSKQIPQKCPNLKKLGITSNISPNQVFDGVQMLKRLEELSVRSYDSTEDVNKNLVIRLARDAKELKSMKVWGAEWDCQTVVDFIHAATKLDCLTFEIEYVEKHLCYEISNCFMDEFRYLTIMEPSELIYFLEFRDLCKNIIK